eukprot:scaffold15982_cov76-Skeletonema_marinoi.AAC.3
MRRKHGRVGLQCRLKTRRWKGRWWKEMAAGMGGNWCSAVRRWKLKGRFYCGDCGGKWTGRRDGCMRGGSRVGVVSLHLGRQGGLGSLAQDTGGN